jgi:hypothetical protein
MKIENTNVQCVLWQKLNNVMVKNGVPNINFKGFMANNVQTNWSAMRIIYSSGDANETMINKE